MQDLSRLAERFGVLPDVFTSQIPRIHERPVQESRPLSLKAVASIRRWYNATDFAALRMMVHYGLLSADAYDLDVPASSYVGWTAGPQYIRCGAQDWRCQRWPHMINWSAI